MPYKDVEARRAFEIRYRQQNLEKMRTQAAARTARYRERHHDEVLQRLRDGYAANIETERDRIRQSYRDHAEQRRQDARDARKRMSPAARFARNANERARFLGVDGHLTEAMVAPIAGPCTYCGTTEGVRWDHRYPMSRGGANAPDNLVPSCVPCNVRKGDKVAA